MKFFITGAAGFVGYHVAQSLLEQGHHVAGYDGMTNYYDVKLKKARLANLREYKAFSFTASMLEDEEALTTALGNFEPEIVIHLAAQAGVRYALEAPRAYTESNIAGTFNLLELIRKNKPKHLLFASTSSVYGGNVRMPFKETDRTDFPVSLYAATKKSGEAMCHSYSHLFGIPTTVFRFFTVYGPWGRPDMALFKFVRAISRGEPIEIYGHGRMARDFTYVADLAAAVVALVDVIPGDKPIGHHDSLSSVAPYRTINIAGGSPVQLMEFVTAIEDAMGRKAEKIMMDMQPGDVVETHADSTLLNELIGNVPNTSISEGVRRFVDWYNKYYAAGDRI